VSRYDGPIVDVDIHHRWNADEELVAYLPKEWQDYVRASPVDGIGLRPPFTTLGFNAGASNAGRRVDTFGEDGSFPGSSYPMLRDQLLDPAGYWRGVLTHDTGEVSFPNPYVSRALMRAVNDWNLDNWLGLDDRLFSTVVLTLNEPEEAAKEIARVGGHPRISAALFAGNPLGRPYGDPLFHPIYAAAAEAGLAIDVHVNIASFPTGEINSVGGDSGSYMLAVTNFAQAAMHHISSYIVHGVFEKYPTLKVILKEYGSAWLPHAIARLDANYELLRLESPWVKKRPSEYIHDHILLSTQPIEESPNRNGLIDLLSSVDGIEDILCFSTDYPHVSFDDPSYVARLLPDRWARKVFCDNACRAYGWTPPPVDWMSPHARSRVSTASA
jgi:predicted TIM-barrel fold metal-dependent hydrolase